jgi:hypothetical protein
MQTRIPVATNSRASRGTGSKNPNHYTPNVPLFQRHFNISEFVNKRPDLHYPRKLIKKRLSYHFWKNIAESVSMLPRKKRIAIVYNMWLQIDGRHQFNTYKQAGFELESALLALIELEEKEDGTK